jgi:low affinity Fe/Cu permease
MDRLHHLAGRLSAAVADGAGRPVAQIGVLTICAGWLALGFSIDRLAACVSIVALVLTQMVLNQQRRQNAALHLKIDELVLTKRGARDEVAGIEQKSEAEIEQLRSNGTTRPA